LIPEKNINHRPVELKSCLLFSI